MSSSIDATKPQQGSASTANVRSNFAAAVSEIEALQNAIGVGGGSGGTVNVDGGTIDGTVIGGATAAAGSFTTLTASGAVDLNSGAIDGVTIGGTTPAAGDFTTLGTTGAVVFNDAGADVDFRVESTGSANMLTVDAGNDFLLIGGNIGVQVTPESWSNAHAAFQLGGLSSWWGGNTQVAGGSTHVSNNVYYDGSYKRIVNDEAADITLVDGTIVFNVAAAGAPDVGFSWTEAMKLDASGVINYGTHSAIGAETVTGYITIKDSGGTSRKLAVVS